MSKDKDRGYFHNLIYHAAYHRRRKGHTIPPGFFNDPTLANTVGRSIPITPKGVRMPYKKGEFKRRLRKHYGIRKPRKRRGYYRGPSEFIQQERKFHDLAPVDAIVANSGTVQNSFNLIAQGTTENERIGRKAIIRSISMRLWLSMPQEQDDADITGGDTIRYILFVDHQCNGANAVTLDLLETATIESYRNLANKDRFTILCDNFVTMNRQVAHTDGTNTASTPPYFVFRKHYWKTDIPIEFDGTTGAITEIRSNNISICYISNTGVAGVSTAKVRLRFDG